MPDYIITSAENDPVIRSSNANVGDITTFQLDFSPWVEENSTVTSVTWSAKAGNASVGGQSLATNVASAQITTSTAGRSLIEVKAVTATETIVRNLDILVKDPNVAINDYGLFEC
jgi:hypothetical protein